MIDEHSPDYRAGNDDGFTDCQENVLSQQDALYYEIAERDNTIEVLSNEITRLRVIEKAAWAVWDIAQSDKYNIPSKCLCDFCKALRKLHRVLEDQND